ncbi:hypothetical protein M0804_014504 [Polistes exclamans]|nr:hypothetical protein M0804_014505 [Polistes exclamans]KAI4475126.1 hypothetical protein M0804_014504 [Polistes exclamans]
MKLQCMTLNMFSTCIEKREEAFRDKESSLSDQLGKKYKKFSSHKTHGGSRAYRETRNELFYLRLSCLVYLRRI